MHVKLRPYQTDVARWYRPPKAYKTASKKLTFDPMFAAPIRTDFLYVDVYKKINENNVPWQISVFNKGSGSIGGVLTENLKPIPDCMLYLYQSTTGVLAKRVISKEDGSFLFTGILPDISYFVVGVHKARKFNAVVLDEVRIDSRL